MRGERKKELTFDNPAAVDKRKEIDEPDTRLWSPL
jgi:hypothetical protein